VVIRWIYIAGIYNLVVIIFLSLFVIQFIKMFYVSRIYYTNSLNKLLLLPIKDRNL